MKVRLIWTDDSRFAIPDGKIVETIETVVRMGDRGGISDWEKPIEVCNELVITAWRVALKEGLISGLSLQMPFGSILDFGTNGNLSAWPSVFNFQSKLLRKLNTPAKVWPAIFDL